jgi:hypothetical protein
MSRELYLGLNAWINIFNARSHNRNGNRNRASIDMPSTTLAPAMKAPIVIHQMVCQEFQGLACKRMIGHEMAATFVIAQLLRKRQEVARVTEPR